MLAPQGAALFHILCIAQACFLSCIPYDVASVRLSAASRHYTLSLVQLQDQGIRFGNLKPSKNGLSYEDLLGVPSVLILCEKGRMGDTFPHTFDCLDMRLRYATSCLHLESQLNQALNMAKTSRSVCQIQGLC